MVRWGLGQSAQCIDSQGTKDAPNLDCWKCSKVDCRWLPIFSTSRHCVFEWNDYIDYIILHVFENTWILFVTINACPCCNSRLLQTARFSGMDRHLGGAFDRGACCWCRRLLVHCTTSAGACSRSPVVVAPSFDTDIPHERKREHGEVTGSNWQCSGTIVVEICRNCVMMIRMQQKDVRIFWNVSILRI